MPHDTTAVIRRPRRRNPRVQVTLRNRHQALAVLERAFDMFENRQEAKRALLYVLASDHWLRVELARELQRYVR